MELKKAAMKAVIELDHSEKLAQAIKHLSRNEPKLVSCLVLSVSFTQLERERIGKAGSLARLLETAWSRRCH